MNQNSETQSENHDRLKKFDRWLYTPSSSTPLFLRLLGFCLMISGIWQLAALTIGPFSISPWTLNGQPIELWRLPLVVDMVIYCVYYSCALALMLGSKNKLHLVLTTVIFFCTASREEAAIGSNFQYMLFTYLIACLFYNSKRTCTARLMQISMCSCYFWAFIHKLEPDFLHGFTLSAIFLDGWGLRSFWVPIVKSLHPSLLMMQAMSLAAVAIEGFLTFGLWFNSTRRVAVLIGIAFHLTLSLFLTIIDFASLIMLLGYVPLWGLGKAGETEPLSNGDRPNPSYLNLYLAAAAGLFIMLSPMRTVIPPTLDLPFAYLDPNVGDFGMFSVKHQIETVEIFEMIDGKSIRVNNEGRMGNLDTEREVKALTKYLARTNPSIEQIEVRVNTNLNNRRTKCETFIAKLLNGKVQVESKEKILDRSAAVLHPSEI